MKQRWTVDQCQRYRSHDCSDKWHYNARKQFFSSGFTGTLITSLSLTEFDSFIHNTVSHLSFEDVTEATSSGDTSGISLKEMGTVASSQTNALSSP